MADFLEDPPSPNKPSEMEPDAVNPAEMPLPEFDAAEPATARHIYQVSTAQPDWSDYTMPSLPDPAPEAASGSTWKTAWAVAREVGETIILTLIIFLLIQTVIRNFRVVGTSMVDNLHDGQYLIIDKLSYNSLLTNLMSLGGPQRGDVVVFEPPNRPTEDYVKRIVALPGEMVEIKNGQVFIDGQPLNQPYQPGIPSYTMPPRLVPEGHVFVLGDNRNNSNDSHNWGPLPIENIVGRAWLSYWPPEEWGIIPRDLPTEQATLKYFLSELVPSANAGNE
ncbi:MAG: signal peptidase I [Chloroflexota bacterium]